MSTSANLCRCQGLNDKECGDASEESGAVWLLLGVFEHEVPGKTGSGEKFHHNVIVTGVDMNRDDSHEVRVCGSS